MDSQVDQWTHFWNYFKSSLSLGDRVDVEYGEKGDFSLERSLHHVENQHNHRVKLKAFESPYPVAGISILRSIHL